MATQFPSHTERKWAIMRHRVAAAVDSYRQPDRRTVGVEKEASTVRLIQFTGHEYLGAQPGFFDSPHSSITEAHLYYLNLDPVEHMFSFPFLDLQDTPLLEYPSLYSWVHPKRETAVCAKQLALKQFNNYNRLICTNVLPSAEVI